MRRHPLRRLAAPALTLLLAACGPRGADETSDAAATSDVVAAAAAVEAPATPTGLVYPEVATVDRVDMYHGVEVEDPYRWLEADVRESPEVAAFVAAENAVTFDYLETLPMRRAFRDSIRAYVDYTAYSGVEVRDDPGLPAGRRIFYFSRTPEQNQHVLNVQDGLDGAPRVLIDPNTWSDDGSIAMAGYEPSPDGRRVVYAVQDGGSDWRTLKVIDDAGAPLPDTIAWVKFSSISWKPDGSGFCYARFPQPEEGAEFQALNFNHAVYCHTLGTEQSADALVYARPESPEDMFGVETTDDGRWMVLTVSRGTDERYEVVVIDLTATAPEPKLIVEGFENNYVLLGSLGNTLVFLTNRDAPLGRIVEIDPASPAPESWREIVPEQRDALSGAALAGGKVLAHYLVDARSKLELFALDGSGSLGELALPGIGDVAEVAADLDSTDVFHRFSSMATPPSILRVSVEGGEPAAFKAPETPFDPADFVVEQVFYPSRDGTRIPMFIAHRKGMEKSGTSPTILYGYGGFNISMTPSYVASRLAWLERGGVFAIANLRGGGEYGKAWHDAGRLLLKQNVFDDFIAAAEYLISDGWTSSEHLAIQGGSNGGLLVGAVVNQRPELFAAALPQVGVMDMLRFHQFSAGRYWTDDYGDPIEEEHFRNLLGYSPYHNIQGGPDVRYPAILATTADTDDRVVPGHTFKYIAALQAAETGDAPKLVRIDTRAGHGSGKPLEQQIEEVADLWAFAAAHTGMGEE